MLLHRAGQLPLPDDVRALAEQLDRLRLDRVRVAQVAVQLLAQSIRLLLAQRRLRGAVEQPLEPLRHGLLLAADPRSQLRRLSVARALGDPAQQVVCRELHVLVGVGVVDELPRRVGVELGEQGKADARDRAGRVLEQRRAGVTRLSRSRTRRSCPSVSVRCSAKADSIAGSPAIFGAAFIWVSACFSIEWASVRYLLSCSSKLLIAGIDLLFVSLLGKAHPVTAR